MIVVVKIGSSSLTSDYGFVKEDAIAKLCHEVKLVRDQGGSVIIVSSAATSVGLTPLGFSLEERPKDSALLRAAAAVGQISLTASYQRHLSNQGLVAAQILLAPLDFWHRSRYLRSRGTLSALLNQGVVPIINENDALADDEISFGDNDNLASLVAHLVDAQKLVLLTDTDGVYSADPRLDPSATRIAEIQTFSDSLLTVAGNSTSGLGRGGMSSKVSAAQIASWSGVETYICSADRQNVLVDCVQGASGFGTLVHARDKKLAARKLWIAFALRPLGQVVVDAGARKAVESDNSSLLSAGVITSEGDCDPNSLVEIVDSQGAVFAKGLLRWSTEQILEYAGKRTSDLPDGVPDVVIHRDDLAVLP